MKQVIMVCCLLFPVVSYAQKYRINAEMFITVKGKDTLYREAPLMMNGLKSDFLERPGIDSMYFKGSLSEYLRKNLKYPLDAKYKKIEGTVVYCCNIDPAGKYQLAFLVKGISASIDKEALRLIANMPDWNIPTDERLQKGVGYYVFIEIPFKL